MKPNDLIEGSIKRLDMYSITSRALRRYKDEECVICYCKDKFGLMLIIKSARKYMAFTGCHNDISAFWRNGKRYDLQRALKFMGDDVVVVNQEEYDKLTEKILVEAI